MPTYATRADCSAYIEGLVINDTVAFDRLIDRAERDIDSAVGAYAIDETTGRKFVPTTMTARNKDDLRDATCAQVEYRLEMGEEFFIRPQYKSVKGPEFETEGQLSKIGPKTWMELTSSDLLQLTTTWHGRGDDPPWRDFAFG